MNKINLLNTINKILQNKSFVDDRDELESLLGDLELRWYFLERLPGNISELGELDFLWKLIIKEPRPFKLFKIFENNIREDTYEYIILFLKDNYSSLDSEFRDDLFQEQSIKTIQKILKQYPDSIDLVYDFIERILKLRKNAYKSLDAKRDLERERKAISALLLEVFTVYIEEQDTNQIGATIKLIDKHFNLVSDDGKYSHYTPPEIFKLLKDYVENDFEKNFVEVVKLLIAQYKRKDWYGRDWKGWDLIASGISQSGSEFFIGDKHFITMTLSPSLVAYYEKQPAKAWKFSNDNCITQDEESIDSENPDFLNRVTLPILLREYKNGKNSKQAFKILKNFICMKKGIPHKTELIFLAIYENNPKLTNKKKWDLIKTQLGCDFYKKLPANVFVERIASDLAQKGNKEAAKIVSSWPKDEKYRKRQRFDGFMVTENTWKLLDNKSTFEEGLSSFKEYISSKEFKTDLDTFEAWDVAKALTKILEKQYETGLQLLTDVWNQDNLTDNQQVVVCDSINSLPEENENLLVNVFNDFLKPSLQDKSIREIEKFISFNHARESLVKFAEKLAKKRKFEEALWLVEKFAEDSDPLITGKDEFNKHKQIINGENPMTIDSVRGWCAWVLQKFTVTGGEEYLDNVIDLVEKLTQDKNYYVRLQACVPLMALSRTRHSVLPDSKDRFMTFEQSERVESIAFAMLHDKENKKLFAVMKNIARVFSYMRSLLDKQALDVLQTFSKLDFSDKEKKDKDLIAGVMEEVSPLFVFNAEFRKDAFKEERYKALYGDEFWKKLNNFNPRPFKELLYSILTDGKDSVRANFAWQFWRLPQEKGTDFEKAFAISIRYFNVLIKKYSHGVFEDVYHFIEDNIENKPDECLKLWKKCLKKERPYFRKHFNEKTWHEMHWWPFFYNGKILKLVAEVDGDEEFLKWLEFLADYPRKALIANDLDVAVGHLKSLPKSNQDVKRIFEKLVDRNAKYFDDMEEWSNK